MRWPWRASTALLDRYRSVRDAVAERMPGSTVGSRLRNLFSYIGLAMAGLFLMEISISEQAFAVFDDRGNYRFWAWFWVGYSVALFGFAVLGVVYLHTERYPLAPGRLIRDVCISAATAILSFAILYRYLGITSGQDAFLGESVCFSRADCVCDAGPVEHLYFSIVTFSTLGFGDYTACHAKILSALQALLGNLHLGMFVGAVFYYLSENSPSKS